MSEPRARYARTTTYPTTVLDFKKRRCALPYCHPDHTPPTHAEITALFELLGWGERRIAAALGVFYTLKNGSTTVRKWKSAERKISYTTWWHLLECAEVVTAKDALAALNKYVE